MKELLKVKLKRCFWWHKEPFVIERVGADKVRYEMKELLQCRDLLRNKRVVDAGIALGVSWGASGDRRWLRGSLADVAFAMRDACIAKFPDPNRWLVKMWMLAHAAYANDPDNWTINYATSDDWIRAATLAWEAKK